MLSRSGIYLLFFLTLLFPLQLFPANDNFPLGARQSGMGFTGVAYSDIWSVTHNPAGLALIKRPTAGLFYENKYILKELGLKAGVFALPVKSGVFAIDLMQFGYSKYNETRAGLAFAKSFSPKFHAGIKFDYLNTFIAESYGNRGTFIAEASVLTQPVENLFIGAHVYNLSRSQIAGYNDERIPSMLTAGISYLFSEKVLITAEIEKDFDYKPVYKAGMEYRFLESLYLRAGVTTNPNRFCFGLGFVMKKIRADVSFSSHEVLGITPHVGFIYEFGKTSE